MGIDCIARKTEVFESRQNRNKTPPLTCKIFELGTAMVQ